MRFLVVAIVSWTILLLFGRFRLGCRRFVVGRRLVVVGFLLGRFVLFGGGLGCGFSWVGVGNICSFGGFQVFR